MILSKDPDHPTVLMEIKRTDSVNVDEQEQRRIQLEAEAQDALEQIDSQKYFVEAEQFHKTSFSLLKVGPKVVWIEIWALEARGLFMGGCMHVWGPQIMIPVHSELEHCLKALVLLVWGTSPKSAQKNDKLRKICLACSEQPSNSNKYMMDTWRFPYEYLTRKLRADDVICNEEGIYLFNVNQCVYILKGSTTPNQKWATKGKVTSFLDGVQYVLNKAHGSDKGMKYMRNADAAMYFFVPTTQQ
jgi:hypothetical protein